MFAYAIPICNPIIDPATEKASKTILVPKPSMKPSKDSVITRSANSQIELMFKSVEFDKEEPIIRAKEKAIKEREIQRRNLMKKDQK